MAGSERQRPVVEDTHFYVDNAPPKEVTAVMKVLSADQCLSSSEVARSLLEWHGFQMQKDVNHSPRRIVDLGLAKKESVKGKPALRLTELGAKVQRILQTDSDLGHDLLHYLHFSTYDPNTNDRKTLWSYRQVCRRLEASGCVIPPSELAAVIQVEMQSSFPHFDWAARQGGRFNGTGVSAVYTWLRSLQPSPLDKPGNPLVPRTIKHHGLALMALDDVYRHDGLHYGDPVLLDRDLLRRLSAVFFLDIENCAELLRVATQVTSVIRTADTLAGQSIRLLRPVSILTDI